MKLSSISSLAFCIAFLTTANPTTITIPDTYTANIAIPTSVLINTGLVSGGLIGIYGIYRSVDHIQQRINTHPHDYRHWYQQWTETLSSPQLWTSALIASACIYGLSQNK